MTRHTRTHKHGYDLHDAHWGFQCEMGDHRTVPHWIFLRKLASAITLQLLTKWMGRADTHPHPTHIHRTGDTNTSSEWINEWMDDFIGHKLKWLHYSALYLYFFTASASLLCPPQSTNPNMNRRDGTHSTYLLLYSFEVDNYLFYRCPCDSLNWLRSSGSLNGRNSWISIRSMRAPARRVDVCECVRHIVWLAAMNQSSGPDNGDENKKCVGRRFPIHVSYAICDKEMEQYKV